MKKYYIVIAKCGHVGKGKYVEIKFPTIAMNMSDAAQQVLKAGKVKKHLKNAITDVYEVSKDEYLIYREEFNNNTYIHSHYKNEVSLESLDIKFLDFKEKYKSSFNSRTERVKYYLNKIKNKSEVLNYEFNY